jgi:hypothetical protein
MRGSLTPRPRLLNTRKYAALHRGLRRRSRGREAASGRAPPAPGGRAMLGFRCHRAAGARPIASSFRGPRGSDRATACPFVAPPEKAGYDSESYSPRCLMRPPGALLSVSTSLDQTGPGLRSLASRLPRLPRLPRLAARRDLPGILNVQTGVLSIAPPLYTTWGAVEGRDGGAGAPLMRRDFRLRTIVKNRRPRSEVFDEARALLPRAAATSIGGRLMPLTLHATMSNANVENSGK